MASSIPSLNYLPLTLHKRTNLFTSFNTHFTHIHSKPTPHLILQKGTSQFHISPLKASNDTNTQTLNTNNNNNNNNNDNKLELTILGPKPVKTILWVLLWTSVSLVVYAFSKDTKTSANAATVAIVSGDSSIKASSFGLKVATFLRGSGWSDQAIVFALATLPVIELRGAIPVGYWMQLNPTLLTVLSILGNMVPVPFIILYLKKFATFVAGKNRVASGILDMLLQRAKEKAGPVEEFQWLGLMLFVAVPFPGTGAWTGAIIASVLDMPFWSALSANFFGVVGAGLLVNLLVNLGLKYAIITGVVLFVISTFMWSILRSLRKSVNSTN